MKSIFVISVSLIALIAIWLTDFNLNGYFLTTSKNLGQQSAAINYQKYCAGCHGGEPRKICCERMDG